MQAEIAAHTRRFMNETEALEATAAEAYKTAPASCVRMVTDYCVNR